MLRNPARKKRKVLPAADLPPLSATPIFDPMFQESPLPCQPPQEIRVHKDLLLPDEMLHLLPDGAMVFDAAGGLVQMNERASAWFSGYNNLFSQSLAQRLEELAPTDLHHRPVSLEDSPLLRLLTAQESTTFEHFDILLQLPDQRTLQLNISGTQLFDQQKRLIGALLLLRDLTERYTLELRLQEAERQAQGQARQLEAILEAVPDAIFVYDHDGRVIHSNKASKQLLERFQLSELASGAMDTRLKQLNMFTEQGEQVLPENLPNMRILRGETITFDHALDLMYRDPQHGELFLSTSGGPLVNEQGENCGGVFLMQDITERKRVARQLQAQAQHMQVQSDLINMAHDAIFLCDSDFRIISWNQGAELLYGWSAEEACGQVAFVLLKSVSSWPIEKRLEQLGKEGRWEGMLTHSKRDGTQVMVECRCAVVCDEQGKFTELLSINRDITERLRMERLQQQLYTETEARRALLQMLLDALPTGVSLVSGPSARLILANRAATSMWGRGWKEGQPLADFLQHNELRVETSDKLEIFAPLKVLQAGETVLQQQCVIYRFDKSELPVLVNAVPFDLSHLYPDHAHAKIHDSSETDQENRAALVVYQDVTTLKEAERLKDEFISLAAHEFRTPLTVMSGYLQILQKYSKEKNYDSEKIWFMFKTIERSCQQLVELTLRMLDVTRIQAGRMEISLYPVDLLAAVQLCATRLQTTTTNHQIVVQSSCEHLMISADQLRVEQILTNLISNALKYSPNGGPIEVNVWEDTQAEEALFRVRDHGIGIPLQQQSHLFERFVRGENTRNIGGTGLGLYLSQTLVKMQGGRIWFESRENQGSTFFFAFPLLRQDAQNQA